MRTSVLAVLFIGVGVVAAQTNKAAQTNLSNWSDSTRDVYIDNELDRDAQVLTAESPSRLALISTRLESAVVLDVTEHSVKTISKTVFQFGADRTSATSESHSESTAAMKVVGRFTRVDGPIYFFVVEGKPVLIRSHPGATGEMSVDKLWDTVPVWRSVMKNY